MRFLRKYNEALRGGLRSLEDYTSEFITRIVYKGYNPSDAHADSYEFDVYEKDETSPKRLSLDESYDGHLRGGNRIRVFYPKGNMLMDIRSTDDWKLVIDEIEKKCLNRKKNMERLKLVDEMFSKLTKEILIEHFADSIDMSETHSVSVIKEFEKPLYYHLYMQLPFQYSEDFMLLDDKVREFIDTIVVNSKRLESEFNVLCSFRINKMYNIPNPVITIAVYTKDEEGDPIGMATSGKKESRPRP